MNIQPKMMALMGMNPTGDLGPFTIYTSRRAGTVWFNKAPPTSPPTVWQIQQRNAFRLAAEAWRAFPPAPGRAGPPYSPRLHALGLVVHQARSRRTGHHRKTISHPTRSLTPSKNQKLPSKFSASRTGRKLPAVCRTGIILPLLAYVAGLPPRLAAFARWSDPSESIDLADSFRLHHAGGLPGWSGASGKIGLNLKVDVTILPAPHRYDVLMTLRENLTGLHTSQWFAVAIPAGPPFDSRILTNPLMVLHDYAQVHVLD